MKVAYILMGITGSGKTFILNNKYNNNDLITISFNRQWNNASVYFYNCINKSKNIIVDNEGLNVEQMYKHIKLLKAKDYRVNLVYVNSDIDIIKQRNNDGVVDDEFETINTSLDILSKVADEIIQINN